MSIESEVFKRQRPDFEKLLSYGFELKESGYHYTQKMMKGDFQAEVVVTKEGAVSGSIYDLAYGDEFDGYRFEIGRSAFASQIRNEYEELLRKIGEHCFIKEFFILSQSNRITALIKEKYGDCPDFKWEKSPGSAVFMHPDNRKWYGIIMNVDKSKLNDECGETEVINVKLNENEVISLQKEKGCYPAYHMNKKSWISLILDDTLSDEKIMELIDESYQMTRENVSKSTSDWLIPANPKYYDVEAAFKKNKTITWTQKTKVQPHDHVYIYMTVPIAALIYHCEVLETDIPYFYDDGTLSFKKVMKIRLLERYTPNQYPLSKMKEMGVTSMRSVRRMPLKLSEMMTAHTKSKGKRSDMK